MIRRQVYGGMSRLTPAWTPVSVALTVAPYDGGPLFAFRTAIVQVPPVALGH
jgi:hypothetical protein